MSSLKKGSQNGSACVRVDSKWLQAPPALPCDASGKTKIDEAFTAAQDDVPAAHRK